MVQFNTVLLENVNEVYGKIDCEPSIAYELKDLFTFKVPGAEFSPKFRARIWDGKIYLFNPITKLLYRGHIDLVRKFCEDRGYKFFYANEETEKIPFSRKEAIDFINTIKPKYVPKDHQINAFVSAIQNKRKIILSPTASGKSLVIYLLARKYLLSSSKGLIIVPKVQLVEQLFSDFKEYSEINNWDTDLNIHRIYSGKEKDDPSKTIYISTWQSLFTMPKKYFDRFEFVVNDEVHLSQAKSLMYILSNLTNASNRIGLTGTLSESKTHELVLTGLFGSPEKVASTKELIETNDISDFQIKCLLLKYPDAVTKSAVKMTYQEEIDLLVSSPERNEFIKNLAISLKGNTLVLFQYVEKHGKLLYDLIDKELENQKSKRKRFFIYGNTDVKNREQIRQIVETENDAIIVASFGTTSTGTNIKNLHNAIFASPSKSKIRNLQSIGRIIRKATDKDIATLYDIADDLRYKKYKANYTFNHFESRLKTYAEERFKFKVFNIDLFNPKKETL